MNSNRHVLRPTHNRLPLQDVSSDKTSITHKIKLSSNVAFQQQENRFAIASRPILTATRSIKKLLKETPHPYDDENQMLVSPMVSTIQRKLTVSEGHKTREQLEEDLFEL